MSERPRSSASAITIEWTEPMLARFKTAHADALKASGRDGHFIFDGNEYLVSYAGYLIEHLDHEFNKARETN